MAARCRDADGDAPGDSEQQHEEFARNRARAVISFLISQGIGVHRLIEAYPPPQFPNSLVEAEGGQGRKVVFTLVQPSGR